MRNHASAALFVLAVAVLAVYLPMLYEKLFYDHVRKTHMFFSPVTQGFITKEKIVGPIPPEARAKAVDHHAEMAYRDEDGNWYTRKEFEKLLPFIYYKNMEIWGLLPLHLQGQEFDKAAIKKDRQVLELKSGGIADRRPQTRLWPLLVSNPGQARLVFPTDRFRMTDESMEFINSDTNTVDKELSSLFTQVLKNKGFAFPARSVNGRFTILKPFDEGVFLVDSHYNVFHVKRHKKSPVVVKTPIDPELQTRYIKISENKGREYYGLLLAGSGNLFLLTYDNYSLIPMPLESYDPDRMDFKLIMNPLYRTAIWSDETTIRAEAMDSNYQVLDRHVHRMSRSSVTPMERIHNLLFPFSIHLEVGHSGFLNIFFQLGSLLQICLFPEKFCPACFFCLLPLIFWLMSLAFNI